MHPSAWVGQLFSSTASPPHSSPPFAEGGLVQVRVRFFTPCKQYLGSEHAPQAEYADHPPLTAPITRFHKRKLTDYKLISCRRSLCSSTSCLNRKNHSGHNKALLNSTSFLSFFKLLQHKKKSYNAIKRAACSTVRKGTRYNKNLRWWFTRQHLFQLVSQRFNKWRAPCLKKICQRFFFFYPAHEKESLLKVEQGSA